MFEPVTASNPFAKQSFSIVLQVRDVLSGKLSNE
jgi:hypothetical protein